MSRFIDARCPSCDEMVGWFGTFQDRPACDNCGHALPAEELDRQEAEYQRRLEVAAQPHDFTPQGRHPKFCSVCGRQKARHA